MKTPGFPCLVTPSRLSRLGDVIARKETLRGMRILLRSSPFFDRDIDGALFA
jgi:hypothetical protein